MAPARVTGKAIYKKQTGIIAVSDDLTSVTWTPMSGAASPAVSLAIADITSELLWFLVIATTCDGARSLLTALCRPPANARHKSKGHPENIRKVFLLGC